MTRSLSYAAFFVGLAALCWIGAAYVGANPLALAITLLIAAFYLMGAFELHRFQQATEGLHSALAGLSAPPADLGRCLETLHPSLQNAVRLRIEGERVALPGPAMTPYLAGLLVLLGMIGTFLGMVVTLNGTGVALEGAADLQSMRASLAAPVKGLGLAFGTSVAGVAASAVLGLISALCRRERLLAAQWLDGRIATSLRPFSLAHQREESFRLLQRQGEAMPALLDRLQDMMSAMERQSLALNERLAAGQDHFHAKAEAAYAGLAEAVGRSLDQSLTESARLAGATIQPVVEAAMAGIAREAGDLHSRIGQGVQQQLDGLSTRLEAGTATQAELWKAALADQRQTNEDLAAGLRQSLDGFGQGFEQRSSSLVEQVAGRLDALLANLDQSWHGALAQQERSGARLAQDTQSALVAAAASFEQHAASLLRSVGQAHAELREALGTQDGERLAAWSRSLQATAAELQRAWQQAGERAEQQQQAICRTLADTAREISSQTEVQARSTIAEIGQLMQASAEAPRAAAEVMAELRQKLSDGMVRDNALLEERSRILQTMESLLGAVNHASGEQRAAIDGLVAAAAQLLAEAGERFAQQAEAEAGRMAEAAAQLGGSAVEVASLGEAFGHGVQLFSQSSDKLGTQLQRIEAALGKSMARSDEQLDYYVTQAREAIDLSLLSQKQIVEDLQRLAGERAMAGSEA
jgi:hypothetical protein